MKKTILTISTLLLCMTTTACQQNLSLKIDKDNEMNCTTVISNQLVTVLRCENQEAICYVGTYRATLNCNFK